MNRTLDIAAIAFVAFFLLVLAVVSSLGMLNPQRAAAGYGMPVTDASMFARILEYFRAKYGAKNVGSLYPHPNVAVEIPLA